MKKRKIKVKRVFFIVLILFIITFVLIKIIPKKEYKIKENFMQDLSNKTLEEIEKYSNENR